LALAPFEPEDDDDDDDDDGDDEEEKLLLPLLLADSLASSAGKKGNEPETAFRRVTCSATSSTSPVGMFGLTSLRALTVPRTQTTYSARSLPSAVARSSSPSEETTCTTPAESRTSTKALAPRARERWTQPHIVTCRPMSAGRRAPARAVRAGQVSSGVEEVEEVVEEVDDGDGGGDDGDGGKSTFDAAIALEVEEKGRADTDDVVGIFLRFAPRRATSLKIEAAGRDEEKAAAAADDDDASAAVKLVVVEREQESRMFFLLAAPNRGDARSWLQRLARRPRRIQRWRELRRVGKEGVSFFVFFVLA